MGVKTPKNRKSVENYLALEEPDATFSSFFRDFFFLISVVIKFIVFLSQLCCALRQRPKEAYHGILAVVFPLVVYKLGQP